MRTTVKDVRITANKLHASMKKAGYLRDDEVLVLVEKDTEYGTPYRLHTSRDGSGGYGVTGLLPGYDMDGSFLGWTAKEADRTLRIINAGVLFALVQEERRRKARKDALKEIVRTRVLDDQQ
jgi:hypothetical protein